jgi:hypothetical protein
MNQTVNNYSGGIGIGGVLTVIFVIAKIMGYITWPWLWVFSPLWIGLLVFGGFFLLCMFFLGITALIMRFFGK